MMKFKTMNRLLWNILPLFMLPAALEAQQMSASEVRSALKLDMPSSWSYLAQHEHSGSTSLLEIEDDAVPLLVEWLELNVDQADHFQKRLEEYRLVRDRELEAAERELQKLHEHTTEEDADEADEHHVDGHLERLSDSVTTILDYRALLEEDLMAPLTPAQSANVSDLLSEVSAILNEDSLQEKNSTAQPPYLRGLGTCPENQCTDKIMIIGCDDRKKRTSCTRGVAPWSQVGRLSNGCSGTLIGPYHVLTAAHCIKTSDNPVGFSLGQFGNSWKPYGTQYVRRAIRPGEYGGGESIAVKAFDYGLLQLYHSPPGAVPMEYAYLGWSKLSGASAFSIGYPGTTTTFSFGSIVQAGIQNFLFTPSSVRWRNGGDSGILYTSIDAEGGQSGSPVYRKNNKRRVVGVLIGSPVSHCELGRVWAARLTTKAIDRINKWKSSFYSGKYSAKRYWYPFKSPDAAYAPTCPPNQIRPVITATPKNDGDHGSREHNIALP